MNPRIEKKLSKRLAQLHPSLYGSAWVDHDHSEYAYEESSSVRHCLSVGGEYCSYAGDCNDSFTVWADWQMNWPFHGDFKQYPPDHELSYYPNTEGFRPTTRNLLRLAVECELVARAQA